MKLIQTQFKFISLLVGFLYALYYVLDLIMHEYKNMYLLKLVIPLIVFSRLVHLPYSRTISQLTGIVMSLHIPKVLRTPLFSAFCQLYNVNRKDMVRPLHYYTSFNAFFTRTVKSRNLETGLISPVDAKLLSFSKVTGNDCLLVKKVHYKLGHFLTGQKDVCIDLLKERLHDDTAVNSCILYLAPGDYHRYHCPVDFVARRRVHIPGMLAPVKVSNLKAGLYEGNERVVLQGEWEGGLMYIVFVGATNVGSMVVNFDAQLNTNSADMSIQSCDYADMPVKLPYRSSSAGVHIAKGDELGRFNMGSTVVLIFEGNVESMVRGGQSVRYGQRLC